MFRHLGSFKFFILDYKYQHLNTIKNNQNALYVYFDESCFKLPNLIKIYNLPRWRHSQHIWGWGYRGRWRRRLERLSTLSINFINLIHSCWTWFLEEGMNIFQNFKKYSFSPWRLAIAKIPSMNFIFLLMRINNFCTKSWRVMLFWIPSSHNFQSLVFVSFFNFPKMHKS